MTDPHNTRTTRTRGPDLTDPNNRNVTLGTTEAPDHPDQPPDDADADVTDDPHGLRYTIHNDATLVFAHYCWVSGCDNRHSYRPSTEHGDVTVSVDGTERALPLCADHRTALQTLAPADAPLWDPAPAPSPSPSPSP